jgi:hypothetical protein
MSDTCQCCQGDNVLCTCRTCHECSSCFGCTLCTCNEVKSDCTCDSPPDCTCDSPPDCDCPKCVLTRHCPNYDFCKNKLPQELLDCYDGRCHDCDVILGRNYTFVNIESDCVICYETKHKFVELPSCNHIVCVECFKQIMLKTDNPNTCPYCRSGKGSPEWETQKT